jgi:proline iminopeptidase
MGDRIVLVETPTSTIHVEVKGRTDGHALLVVNGGPGFDHSYLETSRAWDDLARNRPIIFYDQRGTGRSSPIKEGDSCTLADQLTDLEAVRSNLDLERFDLLGHSWGGFLGMAYTARYPFRVRRLVLVDSAAPRLEDTVYLFKHAFPETVKRRKAYQFAMELGDAQALHAYIEGYFSMLFLSPAMRDAFLASADPKAYNHEISEVLHKDAERFDLTPELSKFTQPTLVTTGRYDMNVAPSVAYEIHSAIPNSRFLVFERSGHLPFFEEPEEFVRTVDEFLSGD